MRTDLERKWYLTVLAGIYLVICSACCLYHLSLHFRVPAGAVPAFQQGLCLAFAVAAGSLTGTGESFRLVLVDATSFPWVTQTVLPNP